MIADLIQTLTPDQRKQLRVMKITRQRLHEWQHGARHPTEVQVAMLAAVTGTEYGQLQREVTWDRAKPKERETLARALGKMAVGALAMLLSFGANDRALAVEGATNPTRDNV